MFTEHNNYQRMTAASVGWSKFAMPTFSWLFERIWNTAKIHIYIQNSNYLLGDASITNKNIFALPKLKYVVYRFMRKDLFDSVNYVVPVSVPCLYVYILFETKIFFPRRGTVVDCGRQSPSRRRFVSHL